MFSVKITTVALVALFSATSLAAAVPNSVDTATIHQLDTRDWVPVDFEGKTIMYNPAALNTSGEDTDGAATVKRMDVCLDTSYSGTQGPWPAEGDCHVLGDWASRANKQWSVHAATKDYYGIIHYQTCVFGAGTRNVGSAKIGSSDISAIIFESIRRFSNDGLVGAQGDMGCRNENGAAGVFWKLQKD